MDRMRTSGCRLGEFLKHEPMTGSAESRSSVTISTSGAAFIAITRVDAPLYVPISKILRGCIARQMPAIVSSSASGSTMSRCRMI